jgi:ketosteroid isomerase-like protein
MSEMGAPFDAPHAVQALNAALESGAPEGAIEQLADGAVLWHNDDKVEMDAAEGIARVAGLHELVDAVRVEIVQGLPLPNGWFQRIVLRGTVRAGGRELAAHNCAVVTLSDDGRISRIDEYVDPTLLAQLGL